MNVPASIGSMDSMMSVSICCFCFTVLLIMMLLCIFFICFAVPVRGYVTDYILSVGMFVFLSVSVSYLTISLA